MPSDQTPQPPSAERRRRSAAAYQPMVLVAAAAAAGIGGDRFVGPLLSGAAATMAPGPGWMPAEILWWLVGWALLAGWLVVRRRQSDRAAALLLLVAVAAAGGAWHHLRWDQFDRQEIGRFAREEPGPACVEAIVVGRPVRLPEPEETPLRAIPQREASLVMLRLVGIRDGTAWRQASGTGRLLVQEESRQDDTQAGPREVDAVQSPPLDIRPGDRVRVFASMYRPRGPRNPGEFDFAGHARADRRLVSLTSISPACVEVVGRGAAAPLRRLVAALQAGGERLLWEHVGPSRAPLAAAILLGDREGLDRSLQERYFTSGTIHLLVVSGLHLSILAACLYFPLRLGWLPRRWGTVAILVLLGVYTLVVGARPPVVRAALLAGLICGAALTGRRNVGMNALALPAVFLMILNPADLFRVGPQLSFLAVATLIALAAWWEGRRTAARDPLRELIARTRPRPERWARAALRYVGAMVGFSAAVWLAALPLVMHEFHIATFAALPVSPLAMGIVMGALASGYGVLLFGWLVPPVGNLCGWACGVCLGWLDGLVSAADAVPAGHVWTPGPAVWWVAGFYAGLLLVFVTGTRLVSRRVQVLALCGWIVAGCVPPLMREVSRDGMHCTLLAMGHGTCVVIEGPNGETFLYDAGALRSPSLATATVAEYLWQRGITRIDGVFLSHADVDHYNAVPGLLERFGVRTVFVSPLMFTGGGRVDDGPALLRERIERSGAELRTVAAGDRLRVGGEIVIDVYHPTPFTFMSSDNANSLTLAVDYAGRRIILPGDLEGPGIEAVLGEATRPADILLAPHHGSRLSHPQGFADWCRPTYVVVSGGDPAAEEVTATYRGAGAEVLETYEAGAVRFSIGPDGGLSPWVWRGAEGRGWSAAEEPSI